MRRTLTLLSTLTLAASAAAVAVPQQSAHAASGSSTTAGLTRVKVRTSLLGTHTWYQQTVNGMPVLGGYYAVHVLQGKRVVADHRRATSGLVVSKKRITAATATRAAAAHGAARSSRLVVVPGTKPRIAYQVRTTSDRSVLVDAASGKVLKVTDDRRFAERPGKVFDPNPVVKLQNESLTDSGNAAGAVPHTAYSTVLLKHLDNSGYLRGSYARIVNPTTGKHAAVRAKNGGYAYNRSQEGFEQVNAYNAVDQVQTYIRGLGFTDVNAGPQDLSVDTVPDDNSWYSPSDDTITFGTGGVDDAEDQEVVWHEYGHAVQDDQVPDFGQSEEAGAMGEGFGDYLAFTVSQLRSKNTAKTPWACIADWDSTSYTSGPTHCLRRVDGTKTVADKDGEVHDDGEIWSRALFDIDKGLGRDKAAKAILESQFNYSPRTSFKSAAKNTVDTIRMMYGAKAANVATAAFKARKIL